MYTFEMFIATVVMTGFIVVFAIVALFHLGIV
jgi:hypothetical protein